MSEEEYRVIFVKKLNYYMQLNSKTQMDLMKDLNLSSATVSSWCNGKKLPRMGKIQMLADYFHIEKSDLLEERADKSFLDKLDLDTIQKLNDFNINKLNVYSRNLLNIQEMEDEPLLMAAHNDNINDAGEMDRITNDIAKLKRPN